MTDMHSIIWKRDVVAYSQGFYSAVSSTDCQASSLLRAAKTVQNSPKPAQKTVRHLGQRPIFPFHSAFSTQNSALSTPHGPCPHHLQLRSRRLGNHVVDYRTIYSV